LKECVDSVLNQNYSNIEIIIVNDGSTNKETLLLLDTYMTYEKISVIHTPNAGQGAARNRGIENAAGDYYLFLDSDDYYLSSGAVSDMAAYLAESNADILSFQYEEFFDENERPVFRDGDLPREKVFGKSFDEAIKSLLKKPPKVFSSVTHTKAIKANLLSVNNMQIPEGLKNEDIYITAKLIQNARTYDRYNKVVYAYRRSYLNSLSSSSSNFKGVQRSIIDIFNILFSESDIKSNALVLDFLASPYIYWMGKTISARMICKDADELKIINDDIAEMRKYSFVLKYSSRPYVRFTGFILRIFGMRFTMLLMRLYLTLKREHMLSLKRKIGTPS
jgi:glycosyltransferase involved in cell wall biosynthesis